MSFEGDVCIRERIRSNIAVCTLLSTSRVCLCVAHVCVCVSAPAEGVSLEGAAAAGAGEEAAPDLDAEFASFMSEVCAINQESCVR